MPPLSVIQARVAYDRITGELSWKHCDASTFPNEHAWGIWTSKFAGHPVKKVSYGYVVVTVSYLRKTYYMLGHRVAWALENNAWPDFEIDHIDGNRMNNSAMNLRQATHQQNQHNKKLLKSNTSGFKGVHRHTQTGRWIAQIQINGSTKHLGCFDAPESAAMAYRKAAEFHHQEFARFA